MVIISPLQLKVRYTDPAHTGPFAGYTFSAKIKVVCYTTVHKMNTNDMSLSDPIPNFLSEQGLDVQQVSLDTGSTVGEGTVSGVETSSCIRVASSNSKPLANTKVGVDKIVCYEPPCKYYCHGGDKELSLQLKTSEYTQHTASARGPVYFSTDTTVALSGSAVTVDVAPHSCGKDGVKNWTP